MVKLNRFGCGVFTLLMEVEALKSSTANEFRIQITTGPTNFDDFDNGPENLLLGYMPEQDVLVAFDIRWLARYTKKKEQNPDSRPSPSAQVKLEQIYSAKLNGISAFEKETSFGLADIITFTPEHLPHILKNHRKYLKRDREQ